MPSKTQTPILAIPAVFAEANTSISPSPLPHTLKPDTIWSLQNVKSFIMQPVKTASSAAAILLALTQSATAQRNTLVPIDEIIVTGQYLSIDKVNAVKTPTPIINVPQSLSIIDEDQIKDQAFTTIGDITRFTPGITLSQGEGHRDAIIIRGQQTTADFFQDGVRDDVQYFRPLYNIDQVEILRGSNALLFGRGGTGGIVNRVTKSAEIGTDFTTINTSLDTFGAYFGAVDSNITLYETGALRLNGFYESLNNHRDVFDGKRFGFNPTATVELSPQTILNLSYEYLDDNRGVDRGVPSVTVANGPDVPLEGFANTFFGAPDDNLTTLQSHSLRARINHDFSSRLRGNITGHYADYDKRYQNLFAAGFNTDSNTVTLDGYNDLTDRTNLIIQANLIGEFSTGPIGHTLLLGAEYADQDTQNARLDTVFSANSDDQITFAFTDPLVIPDFAFTNLSRNRDSAVTVFSAYIQDQIDLTDSFKLVLGGRFDSFDIDVLDIIEVDDGLADGNNGEFSRKDEEISPRLGLIYKPADNVSLYGSYSETFLPRSGEQFLTLNLTNAQTQPQGFKNLEAGLKWDIRPQLSLTAAVFELDRDNFLTVDSNDVGQLVPVEGSLTQGFELQFYGDITPNWSINTGYAYQDGIVRAPGDSNDGNRTRQTPKNTFSLWSHYQLNNQLGIAGGVTYQDSFFVREDNNVEVPRFTRFDAAAYYDISETLRLQINIENIFDIDYFPDAHANDNISTGKPLNARFSLSTQF